MRIELNDQPTALIGSADRAPRPAHARLFLALWPAARAHAALIRHQSHWLWPGTASLTQEDKLHLTLHFIGAVERTRIAQIAARLQVPMPSFSLSLTRPEIWPCGIAVLRTSEVPNALKQLHARLAEALRALDLPVEARRFRPHVTLARGAPGATPPVEPGLLRWVIDGYVLVESTQGSGGSYRVLQRYS